MSTEKIADIVNAFMSDRPHAPPHPLENLADTPSPQNWAPGLDDDAQWMQTPPRSTGAQVDVYLNNCISTCQGGPTQRHQMLHRLFWSINAVVRPNVATYSLRKELISTKTLGQGGTAWSTKKPVLGWELKTKDHHLRLTSKREIKVRAALDAIPAEAHQVSLLK